MGVKTPDVDVKDRKAPDSDNLVGDTLDPNTYYRWVRADDTRVGTLRGRGYRFVKRSDGVKTLFDQDDNDGSDSIRHGDRVLMCISKEKQERKVAERAALRESRLRRPMQQFKDKARQAGVRALEGNELEKDKEED